MMRAECSWLMIATARLPARRLLANSQCALPRAMVESAPKILRE